MKASTTWSEAPATPTSSSRRRRQRRVALAQRRVASSASADSSASSGASSDQWGPRLDAMRVAGRIEGAQQFGLTLKGELKAQLRASIADQFADILTALDERFELQLANYRGVFVDMAALVDETFSGIEARLARMPAMPAIPAFPVPAAASEVAPLLFSLFEDDFADEPRLVEPPDVGLQSGEVVGILKNAVEVEQSWPPEMGLQSGEIFGIPKNAVEVEQSWPPDEGLQSGEFFGILKRAVEGEQNWPPDKGLRSGEISGIFKNAVEVEQSWPPDKGLQSGEISHTASGAATPEHISVAREIIWAQLGFTPHGIDGPDDDRTPHDGLDECCITRTERAYLPEFAGGKRLIVQVQDGFLVDNSELQAMGPGLGFRKVEILTTVSMNRSMASSTHHGILFLLESWPPAGWRSTCRR